MTPEGTVINGGLGPGLLTPVLFTCGLCPDLFKPGAVLIADPGAVAVIGVRFSECTVGVTVEGIPDTLPRCLLTKPAVEPRHPSVTLTRSTHSHIGFRSRLSVSARRAASRALFNRG